MKKIIIVGLGPGRVEHLTLKTWEIISNTKELFFRTGVHPAVEDLADRGIRFQTFDSLYEQGQSFEKVYQQIVNMLLARAAETNTEPIVYGVPGHPLVAEETVRLLLEQAPVQGIETEVVAGVSFLDTAITMLGIDPTDGLLILDALTVAKEDINPNQHIIFTQVYNRFVASDLKLILLELYSAEHQLVVIKNAGISGMEQQIKLQVAELDHGDYFDHLTSVYLGPDQGKNIVEAADSPYGVESLFTVMKRLLGPGGCPWDREQNHQTLRPYLIEEAYEVIEAIDNGRMDMLEEELGDLLLQVVFHSILAESSLDFSFADVVEGVTQKMIRRHPHVFGELTVKDSQEVLQNWDKIKAGEKGNESQPITRVMDKLNRSLPALLLAEEVQKKAAKVGFDWDEVEDAWDKVFEEIAELKEACQTNNSSIEEEMGDLLFAVVNICRFLKINPEIALQKTIHKFLKRFAYIEDKLRENGAEWEEMDLKTLDKFWEEAKKADI